MKLAGSTRYGRAHGRAGPLLWAAAAGVAVFALAQASGAEAATLRGEVESAGRPIARAPVTLLTNAGDRRGPVTLGTSRTNRAGRFSIQYRAPRGADRVLYVVSGVPGTTQRRAVRLAALLGPTPAPRRATLTELTTVAAGFAQAQFVSDWRITGAAPGPQNATMMAANLALPQTGGLSPVLRRAPNGARTSTLRTFNSLANMLARCARSEAHCAPLFRLTQRPGEKRTNSTLQAFANIARAPADRVNALFALARVGPRPYRPALTRSQRPGNWQLFLRFFGDGRSVDGPGNIAFDAEGNAWVANNYQFGRNPKKSVCGGEAVFKFRPDGRYEPGSPYTGGGLSGVGYGITFDPDGNLWLGNFGFAAPPPGCAEEDQPPHNSVSKFAPSGKPLSRPEGFTAGNLSWPQGTVSDQRGNIWVANCGPSPVTGKHNSLTIYPSGNPLLAKNVFDDNLDKPFDIAFNRRGQAFVSSTANSMVGMYEPDGTPTAASPISGGGVNKPMGVASDSRGNIWVSNSGAVDLPCPGATIDLSGIGGSLTLISPGGDVLSPKEGFTGGGLTIPWGMAIDGDDNVWVSNFARKRVSHFCGVRARNCRPRTSTGDPISPDGGYGFGGLTRTTAVEIDPSGNVWITNNWKQIPVQSNPGGYEVVVMPGAAAPVKTPLIGTPTSP